VLAEGKTHNNRGGGVSNAPRKSKSVSGQKKKKCRGDHKKKKLLEEGTGRMPMRKKKKWENK